MDWEDKLSNCIKTGTCFDCGRPKVYDHHVVPRSLGGKRTVPLCELCHVKVHNMPSMALSSKFIREQKIKRGDEVRDGIPFGYSMIKDGELVEDEKEQETLSLMTELYRKDKTCEGIADILNRYDHHETYWQKRGRKNSEKWTKDAVRDHLRRLKIYGTRAKKDEYKMPYGFRLSQRGKREIVKEEKETIKMILSWRREGCSTKDLVEKLRNVEILRRGRPWNGESVRSLLKEYGGKNGVTGQKDQPPYGFAHGLKDFTPFEPEQKVIRLVEVLLEECLTYGEIANRLNKAGYKTREGKQWIGRRLRTCVLSTGKRHEKGYKVKGVSKRLEAPFGYAYVYKGGERESIPVVAEQNALKLIKELYANGYGCERVVKELNKQGLTNRIGNMWKEKRSIRHIIRKNGYIKGSAKGKGFFVL